MKYIFLLLMLVFYSQNAFAEYSLEKGDLNLCGKTFESFDTAYQDISKNMKLRSSDENFITFQDDKSFVFWYFTTDKNPAHPSLVCHRLGKVEGKTIMATEVNCTKDKPVCDYLANHFAERASLIMQKTFGKKK